MSYYDDIVSDDEVFREAKKDQLSKDELLDENFKKAEKTKLKKDDKKTKVENKPFLKTGILLLLIALICLMIVNFLPWAYVRCENSSGGGEVEAFIYSSDKASDINEKDIVNIFEVSEVNSTLYSSNFVGINFDDFKISASILNLGFVFLSLMAIGFIIFQMIDRSKNIFKNGFMFFHSAFSCLIIIACFFLLFSLVKFFSVYPLLSYNSAFINNSNVLILFPVPIAISIVMLIVIKAFFSVMKIYIKKIRDKTDKEGKKEIPITFHGG